MPALPRLALLLDPLALSLDQRDTIRLLPIGPGEERKVKVEGLDISFARWLPDGSGFYMVARAEGQQRRPWLTDLEGKNRRPVEVEGVPFALSVSPDSRFLTANARGAAPKIYPMEGGAARAIPGVTAEDNVMRWSADGRFLYLVVNQGPQARMDRLEIATGRRETLHTVSPADKAGLMDLAYFLITPDARAYVYSYRRYLSTLYLVDGLR